MIHQLGLCLGRQVFRCRSQLISHSAQQMRYQRWDILPPFPQCGHVQANYIHPIVQVIPEVAPLDFQA